MEARTKWITPKRRASQDITLADEGEGGDWWAQIDVTLTTRGALCLVRGEPTHIAAADLPAGVVGTMTRTGLLAATVRVVSADPDDVMDVLVDLDLDAAERLHRHARLGGME